MYSYIKGTLEEISGDLIVVENQGIGYNIRIPSRVLDILPALGQDVKIYTYLCVREDAFSLFGFSGRDELEMFKLLITVSGIGPKGGLAILSVLSPNEIRLAIVNDDAKAIAQAPGVGPKTAKRLVMELKDKVDLEETLSQVLESGGNPTVTPAGQQNRREAIEALVSLGYSSTEASRVIGSIDVPEDTDVEVILKMALKQMAFL